MCVFKGKCMSVNVFSSLYQDVFYTEAEMERRRLSSASSTSFWAPTPDWVGIFSFLIHVRYLAAYGTDLDFPFLSQVLSWKCKLPLQTIMRLLQVLVPQVEKICIDKYINTSEILNSVFDRLCVLFKKRGIKETEKNGSRTCCLYIFVECKKHEHESEHNMGLLKVSSHMSSLQGSDR